MPPRVFIPNKSSHDFSAANAFGELVFITKGLITKTETAQLHRLIEDALRSSTAEDYVLVTSFSIVSCLLAVHFFSLHRKVNYLIYHKGNYVARTIVED